MGVDVGSLQKLVDKIVRSGAKLAVLADMSGLPIVTSTELKEKELVDALCALASIIIPSGETIAREVEGDFSESLVRTTKESVIASAIESDPRCVVMAIASKTYEAQIRKEIEDARSSLQKAMEGIAVEIKDEGMFSTKTDDARLDSFFKTLISHVNEAPDMGALSMTLEESKENFLQISGRWTTLTYSMNAYARKIQTMARRNPDTDLAEVKSETLKEIESWKKRAFSSQ
ncbi:MAG: hypothetical protein ACFFD4_28370 [Candidatus Odinarchaeota archaeon]